MNTQALNLFKLSVIVAYLQSAAWVIFPWAEERVDRLLKAGVKHVQPLHCYSIIEAKTPIVIVQVHTHARRIPVVGNWNASVLPIGVQPVLQAQAPVSCGGCEADEALPVAALCGHSQVPHTFVPHIHLPVVLATSILGCGEDATEPIEAGRQVWLLAADTALLHFGVKVRDKQVRVSGVWVQGEVLGHYGDAMTD